MIHPPHLESSQKRKKAFSKSKEGNHRSHHDSRTVIGGGGSGGSERELRIEVLYQVNLTSFSGCSESVIGIWLVHMGGIFKAVLIIKNNNNNKKVKHIYCDFICEHPTVTDMVVLSNKKKVE